MVSMEEVERQIDGMRVQLTQSFQAQINDVGTQLAALKQQTAEAVGAIERESERYNQRVEAESQKFAAHIEKNDLKIETQLSHANDQLKNAAETAERHRVAGNALAVEVQEGLRQINELKDAIVGLQTKQEEDLSMQGKVMRPSSSALTDCAR